MGVSGLFTFIKESNAYDIIDLIEVSQNRNITIIVDGYAISKFLVDITIRKLEKDYKNSFLLLPVGEYDVLSRIYYDFHTGFKEAGINLLWVLDGPKGVDKECSEQKCSTWNKRDRKYIAERADILEACKYKRRIGHTDNVTPIIDIENGLEQLKDAGAEVIQLLQGEADDFIANLYKERGAYAILGNDSDFVVFEDCNMIFEQMMSLCYGTWKLNLPFIDENVGKIFKRPTELRCPISNSTMVCAKLGNMTHEQLIITSILKGNDFTNDHRGPLKQLMGLQECDNNYFHNVTDYVKRNNIDFENFENLKSFKDYLNHHPDLKDSIKFSQDFYSLNLIPRTHSDTKIACATPNIEKSLKMFLAGKVMAGEINRLCYAIHRGFFYYSIFCEELTEDSLNILDLLFDIRSRVYPYLLDRNQPYVNEWRSRSEEMIRVNIVHKDVQTDRIRGIPDGLKEFEIMWSHKELGTLDYVEYFGIEKGLILYILRYFYSCNISGNLQISKNEFKCIFASVFYHFGKFASIRGCDQLRYMKICPTPRCLTLATWFMNMYYTAKYICGGALDLTTHFVAPIFIMNGSTLFAFYEIINGNGSRTVHLQPTDRMMIEALVTKVMDRFVDEFAAVTF